MSEAQPIGAILEDVMFDLRRRNGMIAKESNIGAKLDELRDVLDTIDEINASLSGLKKQKDRLEYELKKSSEETGITSFSSDRLSVSVKEEMVVGYDPAYWNELVEWAVRTGNQHVIQRRVSTRPILELIDNGVELPIGVRLEPVTKINVRRK